MPKEISLKEKFLFRKIDWVMKEFDLEILCKRMGWQISKDSTETHICTFCPDHYHYTSRVPSHPKFFIDRKSGETFCATEDRGSNLLWTVKRCCDCTATEAYQFITGKDGLDSIVGHNWKLLLDKLKDAKTDQDEELEENNFQKLEEEIEDHTILEDGYEYFIHPKGKKPTNITEDTLEHFKVFQRTYGFYKDRVLVPIYLKNKVTGFGAIDIKGFDFWQQQNPEADAKEYKKVRYNKGFKVKKNLFNFDGVEYGGKYLIIVEGVRDVMKLWQLGFKNVVAIMGKHLSPEQTEMISEKYPEVVYTMFDGDDAGYDATTKICKKLSFFIDSKAAILPRGLDPKNLNTPDEVSKILERALIV